MLNIAVCDDSRTDVEMLESAFDIILIPKAFTRHHTHKSNMKFADANVVENHCN